MAAAQSLSTLHLAPGRRNLWLLPVSSQEQESWSWHTLTLLAIRDAAMALPKHAAEATNTLRIPATVMALPSQRNAEAKVAIT